MSKVSGNTNYPSGTLVRAASHTPFEGTAILRRHRATGWQDIETGIYYNDEGITVLAVLETYDPTTHVLIDPEDRKQWAGIYTHSQINSLQACLRSLLRKPVPEEPTDLAVRVKVGAFQWAKIADRWTNGITTLPWSELSKNEVEVIEP